MWSKDHSPPQTEELTCQFHGRSYMTPGSETKALSFTWHSRPVSFMLPSAPYPSPPQVTWGWHRVQRGGCAHSEDWHRMGRIPRLGNCNLSPKTTNHVPKHLPRWKHQLCYGRHLIPRPRLPLQPLPPLCFPRLLAPQSWKDSPEQRTVSISAQKTFIDIKKINGELLLSQELAP